MAGFTSQKRQRLLELMKSGFENYALAFGDRIHVGALTDSPEENRALICSYGEEFGRILGGQKDFDDLPDLQKDLFNLIERGCPRLDIIDLMFTCTSGRSPAFSDRLRSVGLNDPTLDALKLACHWVAGKISALNNPSIPGPLVFLSRTLPELSEEDQARLRHDIQQLPELLRFFGDLLKFYPPDKTLIPAVDSVLRDCELVCFYNLLSHFKFGCPTLSCLLRTMRRVRRTVSPKAQYLRKFGPVRVDRNNRSGAGKWGVRDPLSESALQRRLHRFSEKNGKWQLFMDILMLQYLSDEFLDQRAHGATFFSVWSQLISSLNVSSSQT